MLYQDMPLAKLLLFLLVLEEVGEKLQRKYQFSVFNCIFIFLFELNLINICYSTSFSGRIYWLSSNRLTD